MNDRPATTEQREALVIGVVSRKRKNKALEAFTWDGKHRAGGEESDVAAVVWPGAPCCFLQRRMNGEHKATHYLRLVPNRNYRADRCSMLAHPSVDGNLGSSALSADGGWCGFFLLDRTTELYLGQLHPPCGLVDGMGSRCDCANPTAEKHLHASCAVRITTLYSWLFDQQHGACGDRAVQLRYFFPPLSFLGDTREMAHCMRVFFFSQRASSWYGYLQSTKARTI
jgi:hypothetical protein